MSLADDLVELPEDLRSLDALAAELEARHDQVLADLAALEQRLEQILAQCAPQPLVATVSMPDVQLLATSRKAA